jgi:hypothetical protein
MPPAPISNYPSDDKLKIFLLALTCKCEWRNKGGHWSTDGGSSSFSWHPMNNMHILHENLLHKHAYIKLGWNDFFVVAYQI